MKILVVCQYYYPEPFRINDICEKLVKQGHKVTVLTGLPNYPTGKIPKEYKFFRRRKEYINNVEVLRCWEIGRTKGSLGLILNYISFTVSSIIRTLFIKKDYDVVFIYQLSPILMALPGIIYSKLNNVGIVQYCLDLWPDSLSVSGIKKDSSIYKVMDYISRYIYKKSNSICISSPGFKEYFKGIGLEEKVKYMPQYTDEIFDIDSKNNEKDEINLLFAGNIGKLQNVETILLAANELRDNDKIIFNIVGDGSSYEKCKEMKNKHDLRNVIFHGRKSKDEMSHFYNKADGLLITLIDDELMKLNFPAKMQTYMKIGKPIISSCGGVCNEIISKVKCGYVCNPEDFKSLAEKINLFYKNRSEHIKMGLRAREYYEEHLTEQKFFNTLTEELNINRKVK